MKIQIATNSKIVIKAEIRPQISSFTIRNIRDIYSGHPPQKIRKRGKISREEWGKERNQGKKTGVKKSETIFMWFPCLILALKTAKKPEEFQKISRGGGKTFLSGHNIYP